MRDIYLLDNNILVDLIELECIHLPFLIADKVIIPKSIYDEECMKIYKPIVDAYPFKISNLETEVGLQTYSVLANHKAYRGLSSHDKFAISIAKENSFYCNSNDTLVRKACEEFHVKYTGILGILGRAYLHKKMDLATLESYFYRLESDDTSCWKKSELIQGFRTEIV